MSQNEKKEDASASEQQQKYTNCRKLIRKLHYQHSNRKREIKESKEISEENSLQTPKLEKKVEKLVLAMDLDNILLNFVINDDLTGTILVRPFAQKFIQMVSKYYTIKLLTQSQPKYVEFLVKKLGFENTIQEIVACQESKNLKQLNTPLSQIVFIGLQPSEHKENTILIEQFLGQENDQQLRLLGEKLISKFIDVQFLEIAQMKCSDTRDAILLAETSYHD